jgi:cell division protein FtsQ
MKRVLKQRPKRRKTRRQDAGWGERLLALGKRAAYPLGVLAVAVGVPFAAHRTYVYCVSSPYFALEHIEIQGTRRAEVAEVARAAHLSPGINIFDVDEQVAAQLAATHPWVREARVERTLPDRVTLTLVEHEPAAVILDGGEWVVTDAQGAPIKALDEKDPVDELLGTLPLVTGIARDALAAGDVGARADFEDAFGAMRAYYDLGLGDLSQISEVHVEGAVGVTLVLVQDGTQVRLGRGQWRERMRRFQVVYEGLREQGLALDYVLVDQEQELDRVAARPRRATD